MSLVLGHLLFETVRPDGPRMYWPLRLACNKLSNCNKLSPVSGVSWTSILVMLPAVCHSAAVFGGVPDKLAEDISSH